jgi:hypothetical protein
MINDAGKHHVNAGNEPVSLRAGLWPGLPCRSAARRTRGPNDETMRKALAEKIVDFDVEIYGRVVSVGGLMVEVAGSRRRRPGAFGGGRVDLRRTGAHAAARRPT